MEIKYTNFGIDDTIFLKNKINGIYSIKDNYIYNNLYNLKEINLPKIIPTKLYLFISTNFNLKKIKLLKELINKLELTDQILKQSPSTLSTGEQIKIELIKLLLSKNNVIVLEYIDSYIPTITIKNYFNIIRGYLEEFDKTILIESSNINNIVELSDNYLVYKNKKITYVGNDINKLPIKTNLTTFIDKANKKGAKLNYYKDIKDLLKAIYRNVSEK